MMAHTYEVNTFLHGLDSLAIFVDASKPSKAQGETSGQRPTFTIIWSLGLEAHSASEIKMNILFTHSKLCR